ncbi:MAG: hydroxymethylglutaryl-CoA lyase [Bacteroidota bacterium]
MKIIECPRDAMQGIHYFIPTDIKISYINQLLRVGFHTVDFGSFVSPKAIPQMRDTPEVLEGLDLTSTQSKLLAIIANVRGANDACRFDEIYYLGYPLSLSETFQQRNTNRSIESAMNDLAEIQALVQNNNKTLVVYLSMGFGNPYGDPYEMDYVLEFVSRLDKIEVKIISLADTIGVSEPATIKKLFTTLIPTFPQVEFGAHLHSTLSTILEKVEAVYDSGCRRMDGAIKGFGGCPMAKDELIGNIATERMLSYFNSNHVEMKLNRREFETAVNIASSVFAASIL